MPTGKQSAWDSMSLVLVVSLALGAGCAARSKNQSYRPPIDPTAFQTVVDNPYFPLIPGTTYVFVEKLGDETSENEVSVTPDTKQILGIPCVVVHDTVKDKVTGELKEDTFDWFAQDKEGNVWYFGEDTKEFHPRGKISTEGSWEAGVDGAQPGIIMKAHPMPGEPYRQEFYHGQAEDMGQVIALHESVTVPAGTFDDCVKTKEWSMLESGHENKWYAKGVGCVRSEATTKEVSTLVAVKKP